MTTNTATRLQAVRHEEITNERVAQLAFAMSAQATLQDVPSYTERYAHGADFFGDCIAAGVLQPGEDVAVELAEVQI